MAAICIGRLNGMSDNTSCFNPRAF